MQVYLTVQNIFQQGPEWFFKMPATACSITKNYRQLISKSLNALNIKLFSVPFSTLLSAIELNLLSVLLIGLSIVKRSYVFIPKAWYVFKEVKDIKLVYSW